MATAENAAQRLIAETIGPAELASVTPAINGDAQGKNFLSMHQLDAADIHIYMAEARAAEKLCREPRRRDVTVLPRKELRAVMRQPSTRTGGSMMTAMHKLAGAGVLVSGMESSSEAKGESLADSWVAFATQADVIGVRTAEEYGPAFAAYAIARTVRPGGLRQAVPVINLGDGRNEHPTQTLGDLYTIQKAFDKFRGLTITIVGDHERYRSHHSMIIGAAALGMKVIVVESAAAPLPDEYAQLLGDLLLFRTSDLDQVLGKTDVLSMGRNPDEYDGDNQAEHARSEQLAKDYGRWVINLERMQQLPSASILIHPRPRRNEIDTAIDWDARVRDVEQMENMIYTRMAVLAGVFGESLIKHHEDSL